VSRLVRSGSGSSSRLLARILERPELVSVVGKLSPTVLGQLIEHVGLEDAGELVAVASTQQLERVWDRDLWRRSEQDASERFAPERFALWLSIMLEAGEAQTVERLRELPLDLLTLGVHRLVRVVDREHWLQALESEEDLERGGLHAPWHELLLIARDEGAWHAVLSALLLLDEQDHGLVRRILDRCLAMEAQASGGDDDDDDDDDALYSALTDDLALEDDVAAERDQRQAAKGFVSAADARAFLRLARTPLSGPAADLARDPVTRAYFRELESASDAEVLRRAPPAESQSMLAQTGEDRAALASLLGLLAESGVVSGGLDDGPVAALQHGGTAEAAAGADPVAEQHEATTLLHATLQALERDDPARWSERSEELGYLANVILAGCTSAGQSLPPRAALEASTAVCSLGLELQLAPPAHAGPAGAIDTLRRVPADRLFRAGYAVLHLEIVCEARRVLEQHCAYHASPEHCAQLADALRDDDLAALPEEIDAELLGLDSVHWHALRALAESVPMLAGALASPGTRFVTTRAQLRAAKRLLLSLRPTSA